MSIQQNDKRMVLPTFEFYHTAVKRYATDRKMKLHEAVAHIVIDFMESNNHSEYLNEISQH